MKMKLLAVAVLAVPLIPAVADTYMTVKGSSNELPMITVSHDTSTCVYADKAVKPGDKVIVAGTNSVLVCAAAPRGPVIYPLSAAGAKSVFESVSESQSAERNRLKNSCSGVDDKGKTFDLAVGKTRDDARLHFECTIEKGDRVLKIKQRSIG